MIDGKGGFDQGDTKQLEIKKGVETISHELDTPEIVEDINPDDPVEVESVPEKKQPEKELSKEVRQAQSLSRQFPVQWAQACTELKHDAHVTEFSDVMAIKVCKLVGSILDAENG